jgi:hypothetical protein
MVSVQNTITNLESQLVAINTELSFTNNFTSTQMTDLSTFIIGNTYQDNNFIQTDTMTLVDIQNMAQALYDQAQGILSKVSQPRYTFTIDAVNFVLLEEFQTFTNQLNLGSIITTEIESGVYIYPVLLGLDINYDDPTQFTMTFGNRLRLDDSSFSFSDLFGNSTTQATNSSFNSENWGSWSNNYKDSVSTFITSALDASLNNVISSNNEEIKIDASGIRGRRLNPITNTYDPDQIWIMNNNIVFTNDNWNTAALALGKISTASGSAYGLVNNTIMEVLLEKDGLIL